MRGKVETALRAAGFEPVWDGLTFWNPETRCTVSLETRGPQPGCTVSLETRSPALVLRYRREQRWSGDNGARAVAVCDASGVRVSRGLDRDAESFLASLCAPGYFP